MTFGDLNGLWAGLLIPVVIGLYLFRRRFKTVVVSGLFLWHEEGAINPPGRKFDKLRNSMSLILQLLIALLFIFLLLSPRMSSDEKVRHLVFVLDSSGSMSAVNPSGRSAGDKTVEIIKGHVDDLGSGEKVTILRTGRYNLPLCREETDKEVILSALEKWQPALPSHDSDQTLRRALNISGGGKVIFFTDNTAAAPDLPGVSVRALGSPTSNLAILNPSRHAGKDGKQRIFTLVKNFGNINKKVSLKAYLGEKAEGEPFFKEELDITPGKEKKVGFSFQATEKPVTLKLDKDALDLDSLVTLPAPIEKTVSVYVSLPDKKAEENVKKVINAIQGTILENNINNADLIISDKEHTAPEGKTEVTLRGAEKPKKGESPLMFIGPFIQDSRHPVLTGVTLDGIIWGGVEKEIKSTITRPLISCGNTPIFFEYRRLKGFGYRLNIDINNSLITTSRDWPILWSNIVGMARRNMPGPSVSVYKTGSDISFNLDKRYSKLELNGPISRKIKSGNYIALSSLDKPGLYRVSSDGIELEEFSLYLSDALESDVTKLYSGEIKSAAESASVGSTANERSFRFFILLAILILLLVEWSLKSGLNTKKEAVVA